MSSQELLFNKKLIEEVKKYDLIYNTEHLEHTNISIMQQTWSAIASSLGYTVQKCRHRWQSLRRRYESEYSRITSGIKAAVSKSHWKHFDEMSFLQHYYMDQSRNVLDMYHQRDLLCRACLDNFINSYAERSSERYNIFENENLAEKLMQCTNLPIVPWDEYPHSVCEKCYKKVLDFHKFQVMCRDSQEKFNMVLESQASVKWKAGNNINCKDDNSILIENPTKSKSMDLFSAMPEHQLQTDDEDEIQETYNVDPLAACSNEDVVLEEKHAVENSQKVEQTLIEKVATTKIIINDRKSLDIDDIVDNVEMNELEEASNTEVGDVYNDMDSSENISDNESFISHDCEASDLKEKTPSKIRLKCDICPKTFLLQNSLEAHQRRHQGLSGYPCTYANCERAYNRFTDLRRHLNDHEGIPNVFKCDIDNCDKVFARYGGLNKHKRKDHKYGKEVKKSTQKEQSAKNWICETCGQVLSSSATLKIHSFLHVDKAKWPYACCEKGCSRRFRALSELTIHRKRHAGIKNYVCPHCGMRKTTSSELRIHINFHTFERKYPCRICSKVFKSVGTVSTHIHKVHEGKRNATSTLQNKSKGEAEKPKPHACKECGKTFASTTGLKQHMHMHVKGEKAYVCDQCGERFKWPSTWKLHMKSHSEGGSLLACEVCGKTFATATRLSVHMHVHLNGEKPYACEKCGERFKWPGPLKIHVKNHLEENLHVCDECGKQFKYPDNLRVHKKLHVEGSVPYTCEECGQGFRWPGSYYTHKKKHVGRKIENVLVDEEIVNP